MNEERKILNFTVAFLGWFFGYLVSLSSSIALFQLSHHAPYLPASIKFMVFTAVYGIFFAILGGFIGGTISRHHALGVGIAIGVTLAVLSTFSWVFDKGTHWSQAIALFLMAPSAILGGWLRRIPKSD